MRISVGICACNDVSTIGGILSSLLRDVLKGHELAEIIVVSSQCIDGTTDIVKQMQKDDSRVKLILEPVRTGKAEAVNKILMTAEGEAIFLVAADVILPRSSVQILADCLSNEASVGIVCGHPIPMEHKKGFVEPLCSLLWRLHDRTLIYQSEMNMNTHATGELMAIKKEAVVHIPSAVVNDDAYLCISALKRGFITKYCSKAIVFVKTPNRVAKLLLQRRRIAYGHHQIRRIMKIHSRTLEGLLLEQPPKAFRILKKEVSNRPKDCLWLPILASVEISANILAMFDNFLGRSYSIWQRV